MSQPESVYELLELLLSRDSPLPLDEVPRRLKNALDIARTDQLADVKACGTIDAPRLVYLTQQGRAARARRVETNGGASDPAGTTSTTETGPAADRTALDAVEPGPREPASAPSPPSGSNKRKRSTERGEARAKLVAALTRHHQYADGGCLNQEPIGNNELARKARVAESTASGFFEKEFEGWATYRAVCNDLHRLLAALRLLNGEVSPRHLQYGRTPPGEGTSADDE
jgi:hypothetical protein